jgi:hypothetical protein
MLIELLQYTLVTPVLSLRILNVKISSFAVDGGGFPPTHLTPFATAAPLTVTASP